MQCFQKGGQLYGHISSSPNASFRYSRTFSEQRSNNIMLRTLVCLQKFILGILQSSSFNLHHHMVRCRITLERHGGGDLTAVHEVRMAIVVQRRNIERSIHYTEP